MSIEPASEKWQAALRNAPDDYEVHTIYRRFLTNSAGKEVARQRAVGRRIVAYGRTIYEELERNQFVSPIS